MPQGEERSEARGRLAWALCSVAGKDDVGGAAKGRINKQAGAEEADGRSAVRES